MVARLSAKFVLLTIAIALVFFGVGLLGMAIATALMPRFGMAGGYGIAAAIFLVPPALWALCVLAFRPRKVAAPQSGTGELMNSLFSALARETPWVAVVGAGLVGVTNLFLNRNKAKK